MKKLMVLALLGACGQTQAPSKPTLSAQLVEYAPDRRGFVWKPDGAGPFPAIVYNHGSEQKPGDKAPVGQWAVAHGYVLFVPHRRGHGRSGGDYIGNVSDADEKIRLLVEQRDDIMAADQWLRAQPYVDAKQRYVMGCSFGGIETLLTAEIPSEFRAAVDFAGASMSWSSSENLQRRLIQAVDQATIPIFFVQAENDFNTTPTKVLSAEAEKMHKPHQAKIFPPHGTTPSEGHGGFCMSPADWGADVLTFLRATQ